MKISYIVPITASQGTKLISTQTGLSYLKDSLNSILRQSIPNWELMVISQKKYQNQIAKALNECIESLPSEYQLYAKKNTFLKIISSQNLAKACNAGLSLSKGKFVAIVQPGDQIAEHTTYEIIKAKVNFQKLQFAYTDHDYLNYLGERLNPFHKPDLSPDFLYCQNYIGSFGIYDRLMLKRLGGWSEKNEYAYDYELNLRVVKHLNKINKPKESSVNTVKVAHLPEVLYHQRIRKNLGKKEQINIRPAQNIEKIQDDEGLRVIAKHLKAINHAIKVKQIRPKLYRHFWPIPKPEPLVSLIIPTRDGYDILKVCIDSIIQKTTYTNYEVLIVNNQSKDSRVLNYLKELTRDYSNIRVLNYNKPFNYSALNNYAVSKANGSILGFINNDTEVITPDWLSIMVSHAVRDEIGAVGAMLYYPDGSIQHAGIKIEGKTIENDYQGVINQAEKFDNSNSLESIRNPIGVTAAALLIKKRLFDQVGKFDAKNYRIEYNDVDLCLKLIEANKYNIWLPHVELFHHESKTREKLKSNNKKDYLNIQKRISKNAVIEQDELTQNFRSRPLISIVMPTFNTNLNYLSGAIESVINQTYKNWELCIADDASTDQSIKKLLKQYAILDERIKIIFRRKNGNISRASNSALAAAKGDFIALFDHDDTLDENALLEIVKSINIHPKAKLFYSDEDKISADGKYYCEPHFKSDWNPDLFTTNNYISHLCVIHKGLVDKVGGFKRGVEGSQDYDLVLRCILRIKSDQIIHIPKILYHWRISPNSTASDGNAKPYTTAAGLKALKNYLKLGKYKDTKISKTQIPNLFRIHWPLPNPQPMVSLIIPTRDALQITRTAVNSILRKTTYRNYEIIIVNNASVEKKTLAWFEKVKKENERVRVIDYADTFNYSAINNFAVKKARGSILGLINNDIEVISPNWLSEMVSNVVRRDIGCVGAKLYYPNNTIQHGGVIIGFGGVASHSHKHLPRSSYGYFGRLITAQNLSAVTAACLLVRKQVFQKVGGLDDKNLKIAFNDVDFCLKVKELGLRNIWTPYAELYHHESISRGYEDTLEKQKRFQKEVNFMKKVWKTDLIRDPYYNPNLTLSKEDFSLGLPQ